MPEDKSRNQTVIVLAISFAVIVLSAAATVLVSRQMHHSGRAVVDSNYHITFTDAQLGCLDEVNREFAGQNARTLIDKHSSRFDDNESAFKIFMEVTVPHEKAEAQKFYINCYVRARDGSFKVFDVFEDVPDKTSPAKRKQDSSDKLMEWPNSN